MRENVLTKRHARGPTRGSGIRTSGFLAIAVQWIQVVVQVLAGLDDPDEVEGLPVDPL